MSEQAKPVDDEDAMSAALAELREAKADGNPVIETDVAEPVTEAKAEATPSTDPAPAAPAAKVKTVEERLAEAEAELHRRKSDEGRVSALNTKYQQATQEAARLREQLAAKEKPPATESEARSRFADLAEKVKDFPELKSMVEVVDAALKEVEGKVKASATQAAQEAMKPLEPMRERHQAEMDKEADAANAATETEFLATYPKDMVVQVVKTDDFKTWLPKQSRALQWSFQNGSTAADALAVMDAYDAHLRRTGKPSIAATPTSQQSAADNTAKPAEAKPDTRLARATGIPSRAGSAGKGSLPPEDDFDGSLEFFRKQRLEKAARAAA